VIRLSFIDDIVNHLELNLELFTTFKIDILSEEENALTIRRYQSAPSQRFFDTSRDDEIGFQILSRNMDQLLAVSTLDRLMDYLERLTNVDMQSSDGSYQFLDCKTYVYPILVEKTDKGGYLYQSMFKATIYKGGI
jgi:hypothetical protein